jgi:hypothetical protein
MFDTMIELCANSRCKQVIRGDFIGSHISSLMAWGGGGCDILPRP